MKQHRRLRKAAKWGGLGLAGVCVAAWVITCFWTVMAISPGPLAVGISVGAAGGEWRSTPRAQFEVGLSVEPCTPDDRSHLSLGMLWWPLVERGRGWRALAIPLWIPAGAGLSVGIPAWRLDRRARRGALAGHCRVCDYDRSTLPAAAPCPECGAAGR